MEAPFHLILRLASKSASDPWKGHPERRHPSRPQTERSHPSIVPLFSGGCKAAHWRKRASDMYLGQLVIHRL